MTQDEIDAMKLALEKIATVNAMDYEYQDWAREALADHAMQEVQRLGQDIEQEPVAYLCENAVGHKYFRWKKPSSTYKPIALYPTPPQRTWIGLEGAEAGWFCHTDFLNAGKYTKKQREHICNQLLCEAQSWDIEQYIRMMHDSTKRKENT